MPASTACLNRFVPAARKKANVEDNMLTLQGMERLKSLGKDPNLAKHARDDTAQFMNVLTTQQETFLDNAVDVVDGTYMSQLKNKCGSRQAPDRSKATDGTRDNCT